MKPIIKIRKISKKFRISHQDEKYLAFRDVLTNFLKNPFRVIKAKIKGTLARDKEDFWALKNISFSVRPGEAVGIIGANGAGKSTLLKILSRITPPSRGQIAIRGKVASLLEVGTGFHPELTGRENIFFNGAILGMTKKEIGAKIKDIIKFAGVEKFIDTPVKRYSSGMSVRLAFSVAAHMAPDILIVDEVLAVGDAEFQKKCLGKMDEVTKTAGRTILFVSHDMAAVRDLCKRCILLEKGEIKMIGKPKAVIEKYLNRREKLVNTLLRDRKDRVGSRGLILTDCYFAPEGESKRSDQIISGQGAKLVLEYECRDGEEFSNVEVEISIIDKQNNSIFACHNKMKGMTINNISGKGKFECRLKKVPLVPGIYSIDVMITSTGNRLDHISNALNFNVAQGDFFGTGSNIVHSRVYVDQEWEVIKKQE